MTSRFSCLAAVGLLAASLLCPHSAWAADPMTALKDAVAALQTQMQRMQQAYESQITKLTSRIETLEREKKESSTGMATGAAPNTTAAAPASLMPTTLPPPGQSPSPNPSPTPAASNAAAAPPPPTSMPATLPATAPAATAAAYSRYTAGPTNPTQPASAGAFNPAIAAVLNGQFGAFSKNPDAAKVPGFQLGDEALPGPRGFSLGESEIAMSANIDPYLFGNLILSFGRENDVSVEEAFIQTTSLPWGFTAKAGRFFSGIGYLNERHAHDWDFIDAPLPYRAMLNKQYGDDGIQLRWLAPVDMFVEFGAEAFRGDAFPAANAANQGKGAFSGFVHVGDDINESSSWLAGLSFLQTRSSNRFDGTDNFSGKDNTGIASLVYKWAPNGNPVERNLIVNGEFFLGNEEGLFDGVGINQQRSGWYLQAVYQFMPRWRFGVRHDEVDAENVPDALLGTAIDPQGHTPNNNSALLEFDTSEFGRFRLQFNRDGANRSPNNEFLAAYTAIFGPHGAHRF